MLKNNKIVRPTKYEYFLDKKKDASKKEKREKKKIKKAITMKFAGGTFEITYAHPANTTINTRSFKFIVFLERFFIKSP